MCRGKLHPLQEPPRLLLALLGKLMIQCNVCHSQLKRGDFPHHVQYSCPISCRWGCGAQLTRSKENEHKSVCPQLLVFCSAKLVGCGVKGPRCGIEAHQGQCPYVQLYDVLLAQQNKIRELETQLNLLERQYQIAPPKLLPFTIKIHHPPDSGKNVSRNGSTWKK